MASRSEVGGRGGRATAGKSTPSVLGGQQFGDLTKEDYAERGWHSVHPHQPGSNQQQFDLGPDYPPMRRETLFEDLPQEHQQQLHEHVQATTGHSYEDMVRNAGASIDRGFHRSASRTEVERVANRHQSIRTGIPSLPQLESEEPTGQRWYAGGPGTAQQEVQDLSRQHHIPQHVAAYMRAGMSHNMPAYKEPGRISTVAGAMEQNPDPEQFDTGGTGSHGFNWNARNAARIMEASKQGVHPMDVVGEKAPRAPKGHPKGEPLPPGTRGKPAPAVLGGEGPKPASYAQSYTHPWQADARPAADRWLYRSVFNIGKGKAEGARLKKIQEHSLKASKVPDPERPGSMTHGVNLMASSAMAEASRRRGLSPSEGQTVSWNEDKDVAEGRAGSQFSAKNPDQGEMFSRTTYKGVPIAKGGERTKLSATPEPPENQWSSGSRWTF